MGLLSGIPRGGAVYNAIYGSTFSVPNPVLILAGIVVLVVVIVILAKKKKK